MEPRKGVENDSTHCSLGRRPGFRIVLSRSGGRYGWRVGPGSGAGRRRGRRRAVLCQDEVDPAFIDAVLLQSSPGPRELKVVYSPLHGVGATAVCPVLQKAGFRDVEVFSLHAKPDGDFPNVPGNVSNPENPEVFQSIVAHASRAGADLAVASDPDCDRIGCSAPLTYAENAPWEILTGNQIGALLADYILETRQQQGRLSPENFIVSTLVTTQLTRRICDSYGIRYFGDNLVGFKWIAGVIDEGCSPCSGPLALAFSAKIQSGPSRR